MLISSNSQSTFTLTERPFSAQATLWIKTHPITTIIAYILTAAAFATVMALVPMSQDVQISVGCIGGAALIVALVILKRNMSGEAYVKALLGLKSVVSGDTLYFQDSAKKMHAVSICKYRDCDRWCLKVEEQQTKRVLGLEDCHEETASTGLRGGRFNFDEMPMAVINQLRHIIHHIDSLNADQLFEFALGQVPPKDGILKLPMDYTASVVNTPEHGSPQWSVKMPSVLAKRIEGITPPDGSTEIELPLISPRSINIPVIHWLKNALAGLRYSNSIA